MEVDNDLDYRDSQPGQILGRNERCHGPKNKLIVCVCVCLSMKEKTGTIYFQQKNMNIEKNVLNVCRWNKSIFLIQGLCQSDCYSCHFKIFDCFKRCTKIISLARSILNR